MNGLANVPAPEQTEGTQAPEVGFPTVVSQTVPGQEKQSAELAHAVHAAPLAPGFTQRGRSGVQLTHGLAIVPPPEQGGMMQLPEVGPPTDVSQMVPAQSVQSAAVVTQIVHTAVVVPGFEQ